MDHSPSTPIPFSDLPEGTVTFLFTDIEGSTRLLEQLREGYATLLADQRRILQGAFQKWHGHEVDTQGDSFFVAFGRAADAIACVIEAQQALSEHTWPEGVTVRVRMGLHTGEPMVAHTGYVGIDVHRAARVAAAGHGGQVLLSETTRELVYHDLPSRTGLRDLGEHKLKDLRLPLQLFQLEVEGLPCDFPPLRTLSQPEEPPTPGTAPFKGLQYFGETDADLFFGRSEVTDRLVDTISQQRFLAVVGASGSGKSSVVRAGLVPTLKQRQPGNWETFVLTPTVQPLGSLALQLTRTSEPETASTTLLDDLRREPHSLHLYLRQRSAEEGKGQILLVVDQLEELFTLCRDADEQQAFIDNLLYAAQAPDGRVHVLVALRADFYDHLAEYTELREAVAKNQEYLGAMSAAELRQAIEEPAKLGGWEFTPGLVELMLHEVGAEGERQPEPGALPLLSHALLETWNHRRGNLMSLRAYAESGGVNRAIALTAERLYSQELNPNQQEIARNIFLRLTELGDGTQDTRRRATLQELYPPAPYGDPQDVKEVLVKLADARLIITGESTAEVAHEALIREWPTLREWLAQDREGLLVQRRLTEAAQEWQLLERDAGVLYRGARLAQALEWTQAHPQQLNAQEQVFLEASQEATLREQAEREAQRQRELDAARKVAKAERQRADAERQRAEEQGRSAQRLKRRAWQLAGVLVLALILAGAAILFGRQANANFQLADRSLATAQSAEQQALSQQATAESERIRAEGEASQRATAEAQAVQERDEAELQARLATSRELTSAALANLKKDSQLSAHLVLQALQAEYTFEAENALHKVLPELHMLKSTPITGTTNSSSYSLARDGELLFLGTPEGIVVQELVTGKRSELTAGNNCIGIGPSLDGNWVSGNCEPNGLQIWEISSKQAVFTFPDLGLQTNTYGLIPPSSNHPLLVFMTYYYDMSVHVWEVISGKERFVFRGHTDQASPFVVPNVGANVSQDGTRLVSFGSDGLAMVWDLDTGQRLRKFDARSSDLMFADFNPDGTRLVTVGFWKSPAKIWDLTSTSPEPRLLFSILPDVEIPYGVFRYSPDGTRLAAGGSDGVAQVWDANTGELQLELSGHAHHIYDLTFSQDGERLYTLSLDKTLKEWDLSPGRELLTIPGRIGSVPFSPDGSRLVLIGADSSLSIVDSWTGELKSSWVAHSDSAWIEDVAWSPDGQRLATASADMTAKIWEAGTGRLLNELSGHTDMVWGVDWSPNGDRVATSSGDGTAIVWDAATGEQLLTLQPDPVGTRSSLVQGVDFSPDGRLVATGSWTGTLVVWDAATGSEFYRSRLQNSVFQLAFCPDGQRLATNVGTRTILWKITDSGLEQERVFAGGGQASAAWTLALSPDTELLAVGDAEGNVRVWDLESGQKRLEMDAYKGSVWRVAFSHDGRQLVSSDQYGMTHVHILPLDELVALTKSRLLRPMTPEECFAYLHTETCPPWP